MMITRFALLGLVTLGVGLVAGQHPSGPEFYLFCRILAKAKDLMYGPKYVYEENADREIMEEMELLYNATTEKMDEFRKTLWVTKDFLKEHPPPTDLKNRRDAHKKIGHLIREGKKKIEENRKIAVEVNEEIEEAKLSVARGIFGEHVKEVPKEDGNLTEILSNTSGIFVSNTSAKESCGYDRENETGKTLINDIFCVCVGDPKDVHGPCHPKIWPPKSWGGTKDCCTSKNNNDNGCKCKWTQINFGLSKDQPQLIPSFNESYDKIEQVCREEMLGANIKSERIPALLAEYLGMIGVGAAKPDEDGKNIFGHSARGKHQELVTECDGSIGESKDPDDPEKNNEYICVDYSHNYDNRTKTYKILWHTKFREASEKMNEAKKLEEMILKNRADLLLLKTKAWIAYNHEKDDETSNLDDMNVSQLFDGDKRTPQITLPLPFQLLFLTP